ncbi:hypothetical protein PMIN04_009974 [Paraphaeosphaeria minitans]
MVACLPTALLFLLSTASASTLSLHIPRDSDSNSKASADYTSDSRFKSTILDVTNTYRKQHNATSLKWNDTLADVAKDWSEKCNFEHSGGPNGENLSSGHETGHFSQLVWKATKTVGCGRTECDGQDKGKAPGWFVVCEYYPPGNVIGSFAENVQAQVPEDEQPEGPSDPDVPEQEPDAKECPQGGDCSSGVRMGMSSLAIVVWMAVWWL